MAVSQTQKKRRPYDNLQDGRQATAKEGNPSLPGGRSAKTLYQEQMVHDSPPAKSINPLALDNYSSWQYPPEFWDRLSKIPLIRTSLKEHRRRVRALPASAPPPPPTVITRDLARFARHGGPDLSDLRGYRDPAMINRQQAGAMESSSEDEESSSTDLVNPLKSKKSSPHNRAFDQHLTDHGIHTLWASQKLDLQQARAAIVVPRPSLSLSNFSDGAFAAFQETSYQAKDERDVLENVFPSITGPLKDSYPSTKSMIFGNLRPLTDGTVVAPKPDIALGALPTELKPAVRNELQQHIIPSTATDRLMAPNFFVEAKGPNGSAAVMMLQARYDGAVGARGMHTLQNYGREEPAYDGKPYTYSSTYHNGQLQLFVHHPTAPTTPGGQPEYHMNPLSSYSVTNARETFIEGATAYRNLRDLAKQNRDTFIRDANSRC